jgi:hydrogenase expression/formation protein HypD
VTSQRDIDRALKIAGIKDVIMTTFGDMMRVPGSSGSLEEMKSRGADIRIIYSCEDALEIAEENPDKRVVFMGVGFETTSPTIAATIKEAKKRKIKNFFVLANFKLVFPALEAISSLKKIGVDGFICPGHVSVITGSTPYEKIAKQYEKPCVIMGFEDADILKGITRLVDQISNKRSEVEIEYKRAVKKRGNTKAQKVLDEVFESADAEWRGIGKIKKSGLKLRKSYAAFDAEKEFRVKVPKATIPKGCVCGEVLQGLKSPKDCKLFRKKCTPRNPVGPCMVSSEGTCAAYFKYGE